MLEKASHFMTNAVELIIPPPEDTAEIVAGSLLIASVALTVIAAIRRSSTLPLALGLVYITHNCHQVLVNLRDLANNPAPLCTIQKLSPESLSQYTIGFDWGIRLLVDKVAGYTLNAAYTLSAINDGINSLGEVFKIS